MDRKTYLFAIACIVLVGIAAMIFILAVIDRSSDAGKECIDGIQDIGNDIMEYQIVTTPSAIPTEEINVTSCTGFICAT